MTKWILMASHQALFVALPNVFACVLLLVAADVLANTDNVSNALQTSQPSSNKITLSKQADTAFRLEARSAPLEQILKTIADKTGASIHYPYCHQNPSLPLVQAIQSATYWNVSWVLV